MISSFDLEKLAPLFQDFYLLTGIHIALFNEKYEEIFYRFWTLKESYVKRSGQGMTAKLTDFAFQPESDPGWTEVPCTDEKVRAMQCKLKEKWILSVCMEKLQADERMREKENG